MEKKYTESIKQSYNPANRSKLPSLSYGHTDVCNVSFTYSDPCPETAQGKGNTNTVKNILFSLSLITPQTPTPRARSQLYTGTVFLSFTQ